MDLSNIQIDEWNFEVTQIKARKVNKFGDPPSAIYTITVADGEPHVESALSSVTVVVKDQRTLAKCLKMFGHEYYINSRMINGKRVIKKTNL
tara:strand:+ start:7616 stop:7891 length:276 start_codon:yes stop_codon:yes gene_type:complete